MKFFNCKTIFILFLLFLQENHAQSNQIPSINSLTNKEYEEISENFSILANDSAKAQVYAQAYLLKAKQNNDIINKANGYYMLATISERNKALLYSDSIITITKNSDDYIYPAKAHIFKAQILGAMGRYKKSMEELVVANICAKRNENLDQQYKIKYFIALLKSNLGEYEETLKIFKSIKEYHEKKYNEDAKANHFDYVKSMYALANAYNDTKKHDSAYFENKKAIELSLQTKDSVLYTNLLLSSGATHFFVKEYQSALDSITKFKQIYDKDQNKSIVYGTTSDFYLGRIYFELNNLDKSLEHLEKVDKITFESKNFFPGFRPAYEILIKSYKQKENTDKQLYYIDRLLKFDSISNTEFKHLYKKINEEYSTPNLISEKQAIIDSLEQNNKAKIFFLLILSIVSIILIVVLFLNIKKKRTYKKRFQELLDVNKKEPVQINPKVDTSKTGEDNKPNDIGISEIIVGDILKNLEQFENNNDFLEPNLTVSTLSKKFKTNSKYLSKVINMYKNKSFSNYVNELRINYVVEELKSNTKFRKYTIKAIANEIGFNTTEAFSKSFYKTTGIYPSFFLKQLEKQQLSS